MGEGIPHIVSLSANGWTGVLAMVVVLGYLYALGVSGKQYVKRLSSLGQQRSRIVNYTDEIMDWRADSVLTVSVVFSIALCCYALAVKAGLIAFGFLNFAVVFGATVMVVLFKSGLAWSIKSIYRFDIETPRIKMMAVYTVFGALTLLIAMVAATQIEVIWLFLIVALILIAGVIAEFIILVENFFSKQGSLFYIFLYLCAAEILPLVVGFSFVIQVFN